MADDKEFKRRVKKMRKHTEALRGLTLLPGVEADSKKHNILDEIDEALSILDGTHPGERKGPQAVKG